MICLWGTGEGREGGREGGRKKSVHNYVIAIMSIGLYHLQHVVILRQIWHVLHCNDRTAVATTASAILDTKQKVAISAITKPKYLPITLQLHCTSISLL